MSWRANRFARWPRKRTILFGAATILAGSPWILPVRLKSAPCSCLRQRSTFIAASGVTSRHRSSARQVSLASPADTEPGPMRSLVIARSTWSFAGYGLTKSKFNKGVQRLGCEGSPREHRIPLADLRLAVRSSKLTQTVCRLDRAASRGSSGIATVGCANEVRQGRSGHVFWPAISEIHTRRAVIAPNFNVTVWPDQPSAMVGMPANFNRETTHGGLLATV
jgi:hypothetical protein